MAGLEKSIQAHNDTMWTSGTATTNNHQLIFLLQPNAFASHHNPTDRLANHPPNRSTTWRSENRMCKRTKQERVGARISSARRLRPIQISATKCNHTTACLGFDEHHGVHSAAQWVCVDGVAYPAFAHGGARL